MREKENSGKKPVRRSTSEEQTPNKVYKPRTAKTFGEEPKKKSQSEPSDDQPIERKQKPAFREKRDRDNRFEEKPRSRREGDREGYGKKREDRQQDDSKTYKPRTLKSKSSDKESPKKERFNEERDIEPRDDRKKSFYEEKYSKPERISKPERVSKPERASKPSRDKSERSSNDRYEKSSGDRPFKPRSSRFDKSEKSERPQKSERSGRFERPERSERFEKSGRSDRSGRFEKPTSDGIKKAPKKSVSAPDIGNDLKTDKNGLIRLNKFIANSGLCSRREADEYITKGQITVNGIEVRELGTKVKLTDEIRFKDKALDPEKKVYILLNKPKDYVTTVEDPNATHTVMELIEGACDQRIYPVGRLDRNSTGLLLFTNDGELTKQLTHPSFMKRKIYEVGLDRNVATEDMEAIRKGIDIEGEMISADAIEFVDDYDKSVVGIEIHSGQNRIVRRIFEKMNYRVTKLDRVYFAGLTKKNLPRGKWRFLTQAEVNMLKMTRFK